MLKCLWPSNVFNLYCFLRPTHRTRFGNAGRFSGFQKSKNSLLGTFYDILTARLIYFSYRLKFSIVEDLYAFKK